MSNALAVRESAAVTPAQFNDALIKAVGWDRVPPEQRALALHICERYDLDPMLRHVVMVEGKPYITRDGLLHVAHRSGVFDGIEVTDPVLGDTHWTARATVYRKDMSRGFTYSGRYPKSGGNQRFAPEMAVKVAEVMSLRRAFDVSAAVIEERWDMEEVPTASTPRPVQPLAEKAAARRAELEARATDAAASSPQPAEEVPTAGGTASSAAPDEPRVDPASVRGTAATSAPSPSQAPHCEAFHPQLGRCVRDAHDVPPLHRNKEGETWK
jgi:hypothetical protein